MARMNATTLGAALLFCACGDGQAGSDYRGEPLMTVRATLVSEDVPLTGELVPAFKFGYGAFRDQFGNPFEEQPFDFAKTNHYVKGEVEGRFPSEFVLRVYDPPPAEILTEQSPGEPPFVAGEMVAVPPAHPNRLDVRIIELAAPQSPTDRGSHDVELCAETGQCIRSNADDCPFDDVNDWPFDADDWPCGGRLPSGLPWTEYGHSNYYAVIYFAGDMPAGGLMSRLLSGGKAIASGYHLLRELPGMPDNHVCTSVEFNDLYLVAERAVRAQYGLEMASEEWWKEAPPEAIHALKTQYLLALDASGCSSLWELVDDTTSQPITVPLVTSKPRTVLDGF